MDSCKDGTNQTTNNTSGGCQAVWDGFLCWPSTPSNSLVRLPCPAEKGIDTTKFASRYCEENGEWRRHPIQNAGGWSNYTDCFTKEIKLLLDKLYSSSHNDVLRKIEIAKETRVIEMTGLSISLLFLLISIFIFVHFSSLKNKRTRIHKNLFFAMFGQVFIRLILYSDQWLSRNSIEDAIHSDSPYSLENQPILCELCYVLMEYSRTSVFMWMFLEGIHLHTSIVLVFPRDFHFFHFHIIGWAGMPLIFIISWASVMSLHYPSTLCWWGYALSPYYWILEGPRVCIILINFMILLNIVCIVVMKVQVNTSSEFQQIRKAVRAALLLLPLLGITNIFDMIPGPVEGTPQEFAAWAYTAHILSASQGFFISLFYCFLNKEVQEAICKHWNNYSSSNKSLLVCWSKTEGCSLPKIRPMTEEEEEEESKDDPV
ncbi:PDF receptor isoform X1 [Parasteatoda tepidariorum]|uniref:PDF receptor isoform X1 n=1 Tax=Parasteatoda tepidariorum TaxID=114398 RepID=UPI0039BD4265